LRIDRGYQLQKMFREVGPRRNENDPSASPQDDSEETQGVSAALAASQYRGTLMPLRDNAGI
jgi:hypothetical protein